MNPSSLEKLQSETELDSKQEHLHKRIVELKEELKSVWEKKEKVISIEN
jgi:DNA-binding transcriptional regulator GbsR (MarR family)